MIVSVVRASVRMTPSVEVTGLEPVTFWLPAAAGE